MEPDPPLLLYHTLLFLFTGPIWVICLSIAGLLFLLLCSALISGSEVAYFSLDPNNIKSLEEEEDVIADNVLNLKKRPKQLLATILVFNNFINIGIVILSYFIFQLILPDDIFIRWAARINELIGKSFSWLAGTIDFLLTTIIVTFILVLFGEVTPKIYANLNNLKFARLMARPLSVLVKVSKPISKLLIGVTDKIENRVEAQQQGGTNKEDIDRAIELAMSEEQDTEEDVDLLKGIIKFGDMSVKQIMRSRVDVVAIDIETPYSELLSTVKDSGYSRIPIYKEEFDMIEGILYAKDLISHLSKSDSFHWQGLVRKNMLYVPESKKINELLKEFQLKRMHMAIVVDEYGGSSGIVTLEDVMEEIIGDIKDEFDDEEIDYVKIDDFIYIFEGKTMINDVCRIIGTSVESFDEVKGDADSLAGILLEIIGHIPKSGKEAVYENYTFKILSANDRRIERIKLTIVE